MKSIIILIKNKNAKSILIIDTNKTMLIRLIQIFNLINLANMWN